MMELIKSQPSRSCGESHWVDSLCAVFSDRCADVVGVDTGSFLFYRIWGSLIRGRCGVLAPIVAKGMAGNPKLVRSSNG